MNDLYTSSTLFWGASLQSMFSFLEENAIQGVELWAQHFYDAGFNKGEYCKLSEKTGVKTVVHAASWDLNFASINEGIRNASIAEIKKSIDLAADLDAREVTVHPPRDTISLLGGKTKDYAYEGLKTLVEYAREKNIVVSVEIMEKIPKEVIAGSDSYMSILKDLVHEVSCTLDIAHCESDEELFELLKCVPNVSKIHISNRTIKTYHTPLYEGMFDFTKILPLLSDYNVDLVLEGLDVSSDHQIIKKTLDFIAGVKGKKCKKEQLQLCYV